MYVYGMENPFTRFRILGVLCTFALLLGLTLPGPSAAQDCLRLGMDEWPPYEYSDNGIPLGMSTDIVLRVLEKLDNACVDSLEVYPWKRGLNLLRAGELDVLFTADYRPARLAWARYPNESLVDSGWVVYVRKDNKQLQDVRRLEELHGLTVGTVIGYGYPSKVVLFLNGEARQSPVASDELNFRRLDAGRIDALICDRYNGAYLARKLNLQTMLRVLPEEIATSRLYPMFSRKTVSASLVERFSATLKAFKKTDEYRKILERWIHHKS